MVMTKSLFFTDAYLIHAKNQFLIKEGNRFKKFYKKVKNSGYSLKEAAMEFKFPQKRKIKNMIVKLPSSCLGNPSKTACSPRKKFVHGFDNGLGAKLSI